MRLLGRRQGLLFAGGGLSPAQRAVRYGLVAAWNGANTTDSFGSNTLTAVNSPTTAAGPDGTAGAAWQLASASSQYLSIADNAALSTGDVDFWVAGWVYLDDEPGVFRGIVGKYANNGQDEYLLYLSSAHRLQFGVSSGGTGISASVIANTFGAPSTGAYIFVYAYHDSVNDLIKISVNGGAFDQTTGVTAPADRTNPVEIGRFQTFYWNGRIANVAFGKSPPGGIAGRANEIRTYLYAAGIGRAYPAGWT